MFIRGLYSVNKTILIFTGGESPQYAKIKSFLPQQIDYVIAADSGIYSCKKYHKTPDLILGDMDSIKSKRHLSCYNKDSIIKYPKDKDFTDTELALQKATDIAKKNPNSNYRIYLIGGSGGRLDHLFSIKNIYSQTDFPPDVWFTKENIVIFLNEKNRNVKLTNLTEKDNVSVFPCYAINTKQDFFIHSEGLRWPLDVVNFNEGYTSVSNRIHNKNDSSIKSDKTNQNENASKSNTVQLSVKKGRFIVIIQISKSLHYEFMPI